MPLLLRLPSRAIGRAARAFLAAILLAALVAPAAARADFDEALAAYKRGDYATALPALLLEAQSDNPRAQNLIGLMYDLGKGVPEDDEVAVRWYRLAASQGYPDGLYNLGLMHLEGTGVAQDDAAALALFREAADQGDARAQNRVGLLYDSGKGTEEDDDEAVAWYRKAAEQSYASAQYNLGLMYEAGTGVERDLDAALRWIRRAAEQDHRKAKEKLPTLEARIAEGESGETQTAEAALSSQQAIEDCGSGDPDRQIRGCQALIDSGKLDESASPWAYANLGKALLVKAEYGKAIEAYSTAIEQDPDERAYYKERGAAYAQDGQLEAAIEDFGQAIRLWPDDRAARYGRGEILLSRGEREGALTDFMIANTTACREGQAGFLRSWQSGLKRRGHFDGAAEGICNQAWSNAIVAWALGVSAEQAEARGFALFDPEELAETLTGVTYNATEGYPWPFGEPSPSVRVASGAEDLRDDIVARVRARIDGAEGRSGFDIMIYPSIERARIRWNQTVIGGDTVYETKSGRLGGGDGPGKEVYCARPAPIENEPPPDRLSCAYWPPEGQVVVRSFIEGIPHGSDERELELTRVASYAAISGAVGVWAKQTLLLREREAGGETDGSGAFKQRVAELDALSRGIGYQTYNGFAGQKTYFRGESVRAEPDGTLRVTLSGCTRDGRDWTVSDCAADGDWTDSVTIGFLNRIDPQEIYTQAFGAEGNALGPLEVASLSEAGTLDATISFALIASCVVDEICVHYEAVGGGGRLYIPCPDQAGCTKMEESLLSLVEAASAPSFDSTVEALKADSFPKTSIEEMRKARRAARSIGGQFSADAFTYELAGFDYLVAQTDAELVDERTLVIVNKHCLPDQGCETDEFVTRLDLSQIDRETLAIAETEDGDPFVGFGCLVGASCARNQVGLITGELEQWILTCKDREACDDSLRDLESLAALATSRDGLPDDGGEDGPPRPLGGDARSLMVAIEALDLDSITWPAPFRRPGEPVARMADQPGRDDGLEGVVYFPMPQAYGMNALMVTVLDSPERARQTFDSLPFLTEKSPKGVDPQVFRGEWSAPGVPLGKVACAYYPLADPERTNHHQCVFHDGASQLLLGAVVQGLTLGPTATVEHFRQASIGLGIMAWTALGGQAASPPPMARGPAEPQDLVAALSAPAFLESFKASLESGSNLEPPFETPRQQVYQESDPVYRERGVLGRVVMVMNSAGKQNGVEFFVYESPEAARRHMERLLITPESVDSQGNWAIKTWQIGIEKIAEQTYLEFDCARSALDDVQPRQVRCAYHTPGSRIAVTSYSYADGAVDADRLALTASAAGSALDSAITEAARLEKEVASAPRTARRPPASGPSDAQRRQMAALAAKVHERAARQQAFVAAEGGSAERLLWADGVSLDGNKLLIVRRACLALLLPGAEQGNECRQQSLIKPYGLEIDLTKLDPESVTIKGITPGRGVRGFSAVMACASGERCARVTVDSVYSRIIAKSFAETLDQPTLFLACESHGACSRLADDLEALTRLARDGVAPGPPAVQSLVGAWEMTGLGVMEFRADGTYTFHQPNFGHAGTYRAENGVWSLSSETPAMPWEDGGTYRLVDPNTLELVGKLGPGTWTRTSPPGG